MQPSIVPFCNAEQSLLCFVASQHLVFLCPLPTEANQVGGRARQDVVYFTMWHEMVSPGGLEARKRSACGKAGRERAYEADGEAA